MRRFLSLWLNQFISAAVLMVCARILFQFNEHGLPVRMIPDSLEYLKYFTVLSNLLMGAASLLYIIALQLRLCGALRRVPKPICLLKYMATSALSVTFLTVLGYIGPRTGFRGSYRGANLWLHLILPLAAVLDFTLLDREGRHPLSHAFITLALPALYGAAYLGNLILNGYGGREHPNDWYGFAANGPAGVFAVIAGILAAGLGASLLLRLPRKRKKPRHAPKGGPGAPADGG